MADQSPNTLKMPTAQTALVAEVHAERMVEVELLNDVWVEDKDNPESVGGIRRIKTNVPVLDQDGNPMMNKATKTPITTLTKSSLPVSLAKKMIDAGKANRADPL